MKAYYIILRAAGWMEGYVNLLSQLCQMYRCDHSETYHT